MTTATRPPAAGPMTIDEFTAWASRPENADRKWELERGVPVEMPPTHEPHAFACWYAITLLTDYVRRRKSGHILTHDCGLVIDATPTVRGPDIMLFLGQRTLREAKPANVDRVPDLIVEIHSPSDRPGRVSRRVAEYHARGVPVVWVVYPDDESVDVRRPGRAPEPKAGDDIIDGGAELPDFTCRAADLFRLPGGG